MYKKSQWQAEKAQANIILGTIEAENQV